MTSAFRIGQHIEGNIGTYIISKQLHQDIWTATYCGTAPYSLQPLTLDRSSTLGKVIIKTAPKYRLDNERDILKHFHALPGIRQLLDETQHPPTLVLKHFDDNLLSASNSRRLEKVEVKKVPKGILEALQVLHPDCYVHTGTEFPTPPLWSRIWTSDITDTSEKFQMSNQITFSLIMTPVSLGFLKLSLVIVVMPVTLAHQIT